MTIYQHHISFTIHFLSRNLDRAADAAISKVSVDVLTIGVCGGAAPGGGEAPGVGAGVVNHALVDEGELAGGGAGGHRGRGGHAGGGGGTGAGVAVAIVALHVVTVRVSSGGAPGLRVASSCGAARVGHAPELEGEHALSTGSGSIYSGAYATGCCGCGANVNDNSCCCSSRCGGSSSSSGGSRSSSCSSTCGQCFTCLGLTFT